MILWRNKNMKVLKVTTESRADTETEAKLLIDQYKKQASEQGYVIKSIGYTYKVKKSKGDIIDEAYVVKCVQEFHSLWEE